MEEALQPRQTLSLLPSGHSRVCSRCRRRLSTSLHRIYIRPRGHRTGRSGATHQLADGAVQPDEPEQAEVGLDDDDDCRNATPACLPVLPYLTSSYIHLPHSDQKRRCRPPAV